MEEKPIIKKPLIGTIIKYLRDFSIVVAGIAVTLYVNDRITNQSEKRDLKLYLNAIKLELQENVRDINDVITSMQGSIGYANYLRAHDKKTLNADTIMSYAENGYYLIQTMTYKTNAFEMFKLSGTMRLMGDKELLLTIWETYTHLEEVKTLFEMAYQMKFEEIKKEIQLSPEERQKNVPMYTFYTATDWSYEMPRIFSETLEKLNKTIEALEKAI